VKRSRHQQAKQITEDGINCLVDRKIAQSKVVPFPNDAAEVLTEKDHKLMNLTQLGRELNVSPDFVKDMRTMGFPLPVGGMTTLTFAIT
jgi:hypothetical protein